MEKSPTISELIKSLVSFQKEVKTIGYDANNPFFKSGYATLGALVESTKQILAKNGLVVSQLAEDSGGVTTMLLHVSGEYLSSKLTLKPVKDDPQGNGSCISYARRYSYASILNLVSDKDDDGNAATGLKKKEEPVVEIKPVGLKDRVIGTGISKLGDADKFKLWRVENNLKEDLTNATDQELNWILSLLREYKPLNKMNTSKV